MAGLIDDGHSELVDLLKTTFSLPEDERKKAKDAEQAAADKDGAAADGGGGAADI